MFDLENLKEIPLRLLRPGDLFILSDAVDDVKPENVFIAFCISNERYEGESGGYGRHVRFTSKNCRIRDLFWSEEAKVVRHAEGK